jgi:hypothetical protein
MSETSEGTTVDVEARKIPADAPERVYLNLCEETDCEEPFWEHHRHGDGILWTADTPALLCAVGYVRADTHDALCARVRELEAVLRRCRQGHENLIEVGALPHAGWNDAAREVIAEIDAALAPSQPEAAR